MTSSASFADTAADEPTTEPTVSSEPVNGNNENNNNESEPNDSGAINAPGTTDSEGKITTEKTETQIQVKLSLIAINPEDNSKVNWIENREEKIDDNSSLASLIKIVLKEIEGKCEISEGGIITSITGPAKYGFGDQTLTNNDEWQWEVSINGSEIDSQTNIENIALNKGDDIEIRYSTSLKNTGALSLSQPISTLATNEDVAFVFGNTKDKVLSSYNDATWDFEYSFDIMGLARAGYLTQAQKDAFYNNVANRLISRGSSIISDSWSSDNSKTIIALTASGKDATNVGGYNMLEPLANYSYLTAQGLNGPLWALIAFDCGNYDIPAAKVSSQQVTREKLITSLLSGQHSDGGWAYSGSSDIDMTGMVIQALAPYYKSKANVKTAVDKGLSWLSSHQNNKGFFTTGTVSSEAQSQVIVALTSLGINPMADSRFIKNGKNAIDALMSFYVAGGGYKHVSENWKANGLATTQGNYALTAYYRLIDGVNSLYLMSDNNSGYTVGVKYDGDKDTPTKPIDPTDPNNTQGAKAAGATKALGLLKLNKNQIKKMQNLQDDLERNSQNGLGETNKADAYLNNNIDNAMPWIIGAIICILAVPVLLVMRRRFGTKEETENN